MNKIRYYRFIQWLIPGMLLFSGCENFLGIEPDSTRASIKTPLEVSQLLTTAYPQGSYVLFSESMSDNVSDKGVGEEDRTNRDAYRFDVVTTTVDEQDSPDMYWSECYRAISVANQALEIIRNAEDPSAFNAQKGEALLARAYSHLMLVSFFSKFYEPDKSNDSPGIPYVTEPEKVVIKEYDRKTVAYVYEMIEKDLEEGVPLIDDASYTVPSFHFNKAAAHALASRFYLIKKNYEKVISHANEVFGGSGAGSFLRNWNTTYASMSPEVLFNTYSRSTERANLLIIETSSLFGRNVANYRYGLTFAKYSEIFYSSRIVGNESRWVQPLYYRGDGNYFVPKLTEYFVRESVNAEFGQPYVMLPVLTAEEVLFNRAEAYAILNRNNEALDDLNLYLSKRIANYNQQSHLLTIAKVRSFYSTTNNTAGLINTILDFKRVEFMQEGMRWLDMQRMRIPVVHTSGTGTISLDADDPKRILQLPQSTALSGLSPNTR